jgi:putative DNA primase/helicase
VKDLAGGDKLIARQIYERPIEFDPTHKLIIVGNTLPDADSTDEGLWRRITIVQFEHRFPAPGEPGNRDRSEVEGELWQERSGILNWLLEGLHEVKRNGLVIPACVRAHTRKYRNEVDWITQFITDACEAHANGQTLLKDLYQAYAEWVRDQGGTPCKSRTFQGELKRRGYPTVSGTGNKRYVSGLNLNPSGPGKRASPLAISKVS